MFLNELTAEQKRAFFVLARQVIAADERLALQELVRLEALYHEAQLPPETPAAPDVVGDLNYMFASTRARAVVVLELLLLVIADASVDRRELTTVRSIAERMEVEEEAWGAMRDWVGRYGALVAEACAFGEA